MAIVKKFNETDFTLFERDLLSVLKADPDHKIDFDGKLFFHSRQFDCNLAATDVHWDEKTGDIVLVGAFKSGRPVMDDSKDYPVMRTSVSVPLKECFEDLKNTSGCHMKLIDKAKKAVLQKYLVPMVNLFNSRGMFDYGIMNLPSFDCGNFRLGDSYVVGLAKGEDGKINLLCTNSFNPNFTVDAVGVNLKAIQNFCHQLEIISDKFRDACDVYLETKQKLAPVSMSYSSIDEKRNVDASLIALYESGAPARIIDLAAKHMANVDYFDPKKYSGREIHTMVMNYKNTGILKPSNKNISQSL